MNVRCFQHLINFASFSQATPELTHESLTMFSEHSSFDTKLLSNLVLFLVVPLIQVPAVERFYNVTIWNSPNSEELVKDDSIVVFPNFMYPNDGPYASSFSGWNLMSSYSRRIAILQAMQHTWGVTEPLIFKATEIEGMFAFHSISTRKPTRSTPFPNWIGAVGLGFSQFFTSTLDKQLGSNITSPVAIYISTESGNQVFTYKPNDNNETELHRKYMHNTTFSGFATQWHIKVIPTPHYISKFHSPVPFIIFGCTLSVFVLLAVVVKRGMKRFLQSQQMLRRLQLQDKLISSLQEYSKVIIQAIPDGIVMLDHEGRIIGINEAALKLTGYSLTDFAVPTLFSSLLEEQDETDNTLRRNNHNSITHEQDNNHQTIPSVSSLTTLILSNTDQHNNESISNHRLDQSQSTPNSHQSQQNPASVLTLRGSSSIKRSIYEPGDRIAMIRCKDNSCIAVQLSISRVEDPHVDPDADTTTSTSNENTAYNSQKTDGGLFHRHRRTRTVSGEAGTTLSDHQSSLLGSLDTMGHVYPLRSESYHEPPSNSDNNNTSSFAYVILFHDISQQVANLHETARMGREANETSRARHQLLRFLIRCIHEPSEKLSQDIIKLYRLQDKNDSIINENKAAIRDAYDAATHVLDVLEDVIVYAGISMETIQYYRSMNMGSTPRVTELVQRCVTPKDNEMINNSKVNLMTTVDPINGYISGDSTSMHNLCILIHKLSRFAYLIAGKGALMTLSVEMTNNNNNNGTTDTTSRILPPPSIYGSVILTLSGFDSRFPNTPSSDNEDKNNNYLNVILVGSRGSEFGNYTLKWVALIRMVSRLGGHIKQTRVTSTTGLTITIQCPFHGLQLNECEE